MAEKPIQLLLVEDNLGDARLFEEYLKESGRDSYHLEHLTRLSACLERLQKSPVDVVVLDLSLPDANGLETFHQVHQAAPQVPILILTGNDDEKVAMESLKNGAQDYILKGHLEGRQIARTLQYAMERSHLLQRVNEEEKHYELTAIGSNDGLWDWDLVTDRVYFSPRWKLMLGYGHTEIRDSMDEWFNRVHAEDQARLSKDLADHLAGKTPLFSNEHRLEHKNKTWRWVLGRGMAIFDLQHRAVRMAGSFTDITDHKNLEQYLAQQAFYDPLTHLPNRVLFMENLERSFARAQRNPRYLFAVFFLDMDRLKFVNDNYGHLAGDQLLAKLSDRLRGCLRPNDSVARVGGDEFTILLDDLKNREEALSVAERILKDLRTPFTVDGNEVFETVSFGIAFSNCGCATPGELLKAADTAMYHAKNHGKARYEIFDRSTHAPDAVALKMEADLRQAVQRQEFFTLYQPILRLDSGKIAGAELLLRWMHPRQGILLPSSFLPTAEECGLSSPIFEWALRVASLQTLLWHNAGYSDLFLCVELTPQLALNPVFPDLMRKVLKETGLKSRFLEIEIPGWILLKERSSIPRALEDLHKMGVQITLGHYGTSFATLNELKDFPIHNLKLDRDFVKNMTQNPMDASLGGMIIAAAHNLGLRVSASGVGEKDQLDFLRKNDCDEVQGDLLSPPLTTDQFAQSLLKPIPVKDPVQGGP